MKKLILIGIVPFLFACATASLTEGGRHVRMVSVSPNGCKYIQEVEGYYKDSSHGGIAVHDNDVHDFALIDLKNKAAQVGADTVEHTRGQVGGVVRGEAYYCGNGLDRIVSSERK